MISIIGIGLVVVGLLSNNPGNLETNKNNHWVGKVVCEKASRFECFSTPYYGIRATVITLRTYYEKRKLRTVRQIISRWAPRQDDNPTEAYINFVASRLNVAPDEHLTFHPGQVGLLVMAIVKMENGSNPYPISLIRRVINGLTFRDFNNGRRDTTKWRTVSVEDEARSYPAKSNNRIIEDKATSTSSKGSKRQHGQGISVDKKNHSPDSRISHHSLAKVRTIIYPHMDGRCGWLDTVESWISIPRRDKQRRVEDHERYCYNPFRYPFPVSSSWPLFW